MGKIWMTGSAGGGITSDDVTVTRAMLPKGYTGVTKDSDDEVVEGQAD